MATSDERPRDKCWSDWCATCQRSTEDPAHVYGCDCPCNLYAAEQPDLAPWVAAIAEGERSGQEPFQAAQVTPSELARLQARNAAAEMLPKCAACGHEKYLHAAMCQGIDPGEKFCRCSGWEDRDD